MDAPNPYGGLRRLMAFVGGLDLTGGRWDTPGMREKPNVIAFLIVFFAKKIVRALIAILTFTDHELFKTLLNEHYGDFRNSNAPTVPPEQGPREPWRDIHSRVEGPVAHDVFLNFYERWSKQGKKEGHLQPIDQTK